MEKIEVIYYANPTSLRAADLSGRHTIYLGCLRPDGNLRRFLPDAYEWAIADYGLLRDG